MISDNIKEVSFFECTCSKCKMIIYNNRGWPDLQKNGWKQIGGMLFCPGCYAPYANLSPQVGDRVQCLLQTDSWGKIKFGETYSVCELVKNDPGTIYVDVGDGWQRKLVRGEYQMA